MVWSLGLDFGGRKEPRLVMGRSRNESVRIGESNWVTSGGGEGRVEGWEGCVYFWYGRIRGREERNASWCVIDGR